MQSQDLGNPYGKTDRVPAAVRVPGRLQVHTVQKQDLNHGQVGRIQPVVSEALFGPLVELVSHRRLLRILDEVAELAAQCVHEIEHGHEDGMAPARFKICRIQVSGSRHPKVGVLAEKRWLVQKGKHWVHEAPVARDKLVGISTARQHYKAAI